MYHIVFKFSQNLFVAPKQTMVLSNVIIIKSALLQALKRTVIQIAKIVVDNNGRNDKKKNMS